MEYKQKDVEEFLRESNAIEGVYDELSLKDALRAWNYGVRNSRQGMTTNFILKVHEYLMIRLNLRIAGKFRNCSVTICGRVCHYVDEYLLKEEMKGWIKVCDFKKLREDYKTNARRAEAVKDWHVMFEMLHPFEDGNGRTGRILLNLHRKRLGLPIEIIYEKNKHYYYNWFE